MEAASARFATRDRFGVFGEQPRTQLQRYIQNAVDPQNYEPNLALNLEISDLINSKKGNAPREAAVTIVRYINHRNHNVARLALALLDICVKNCGYPFHLQISTKEFLNELVRKFPERPPLRPTPVQQKILEAIEEWRQTICQTSRYKEDLGFIRDMHRLLLYKGYMFPEVRTEDAAVLNPSDNLQSADEMEEEEKAAQSAKLQELIRRGGPEDLQEANRLMKVMAGYDTKHRTDYRAKAAEEVNKIQQKAKLLEERLQNFKPGDVITEGDVFDDLANALQSAQPKIQKMCEEEQDDSEAVAKLLEINDSIHRTVERYKLVKKGDVDAASRIPKGTLGTSTGVSKTADNELSLIDLGGDFESTSAPHINQTTESQSKMGSLEDDLLGLSFQDGTYGQGGGIALGLGANSGPSLQSSFAHQTSSTATPPRVSPPPPSDFVTVKPNYNPFASRNTIQSSSGSRNPISSVHLTNKTQLPPSSQSPQLPSDPFAMLSSPTPRQPSPLLEPQSSKGPTSSPSSSIFNFASSIQPPATPNPPSLHHRTNSASTDDDWDFASALPEEGSSLPATNELVVSETVIRIRFKISRASGSRSEVMILAHFSNIGDALITEYTFQVAAKPFSLRLEPQSGRTLQPRQQDGITQPIEIHGVPLGQANSIKMRWKASYKMAGDFRHEEGEISPLGIV